MAAKAFFAMAGLVATVCVTSACGGGATNVGLDANAAAQASAVPASGHQICGRPILDSPWNYAGKPGTYGPKNEPKGLPSIGSAKANFPQAKKIIVVPAGNNTRAAVSGNYNVDNAVVYFEPGMHEIENLMYTGHDSVYLGGYNRSKGKAIINGVDGATHGTGKGGSRPFVSTPSSGNKVYNTWEFLTVENYTSDENNSVMGNVNGGGSDIGDVYKYDTIGPNQYGYSGTDSAPRRGESSGGGYAIDAGSDTAIEYNCLVGNAQGAFNAWGTVNLRILDNEISWNGLGEYPDSPGTGGSPFGCGCSGGGKVFYSMNTDVIGNYIHNNYNDGIWFDFDNAGADIAGNYIASNWGNAIAYEASYNAHIVDNKIVGNGWASDGPWPAGLHGGTCYGGVSCTDGLGPVTGAGGGNAYAAIDLSNSGGNANLGSRYAGNIWVAHNDLVNNFGGVKVYTDTNRYPGNVDNDSACSIPLGTLGRVNSKLYYKQAKVLITHGDADVTGTAVQTAGGTQTICAGYGQQTDRGPADVVQAPSVGMAVYIQSTGAFLGTVTAVENAHSFALSRPPGTMTDATLLLSAYGGCGPADYYGGGLNVYSGEPRAEYWNNCTWGSRNVTVNNNTFAINAAVVAGCTTAKNLCGYMQAIAFNAGVPALMQFFDSYAKYVPMATGGLGNVWSKNIYDWSGSSVGWRFEAGLQTHNVSRAQWRARPDGQDSGSVFK
jgi:hypothetical protein